MCFKKLLLMSFIVLASMCLHAQNNMNVIANFIGEHFDSGFGKTMVSLDFNHDGFDDLAVCAYSFGFQMYPNIPARGKVYIYYGGPGFSSSTAPSITLEGTFASGYGIRIWALHMVGDINGDGFEDLCIRISDYIAGGNGHYRLLFFYGGTSNLDNPNYSIDFDNDLSYCGVTKLGDVNGDGYDDLGLDTDINGLLRLSILWGGSFTEQMVSVGEGTHSSSRAIIGIGDINNDGFADFTTGFSNPDPDTGFHLIRLYYGNAQGNTDNPVVMIQTQDPITKVSMPLGDVNADGYDDFMGYVSNAGMHVWLGGTNISYATPSYNLSPAWWSSEITPSITYGDFNGDNFDDVVSTSTVYCSFSVWLGKQMINGTSDFITSQPYEKFGYSIATGDFNADSYDDIAVAAPFEYQPEDPPGTYNGFVWVYGGNAQLADTTVANDDPSIPELAEQMQVHVSPNPVPLSDSSINVRIDYPKHIGASNASIEIFNIKGQRVASQDTMLSSGTMNCDIDLPNLANGVYLCRVQAGEQSASVKLSIVK